MTGVRDGYKSAFMVLLNSCYASLHKTSLKTTLGKGLPRRKHWLGRAEGVGWRETGKRVPNTDAEHW